MRVCAASMAGWEVKGLLGCMSGAVDYAGSLSMCEEPLLLAGIHTAPSVLRVQARCCVMCTTWCCCVDSSAWRVLLTCWLHVQRACAALCCHAATSECAWSALVSCNVGVSVVIKQPGAIICLCYLGLNVACSVQMLSKCVDCGLSRESVPESLCQCCSRLVTW